MQLARQGNERAIATLLSRAFSQQGIVVKIKLKDRCLQTLLEAQMTPDPAIALATMQRVMSQLQPEGLDLIQVYGRQTGTTNFAWQHKLHLKPIEQPEAQVPEPQELVAELTPQLREQARQGDPTAIAAFLNQALAPQQLTVQVSWQDYCLHIFLQGKTVPDQAKILLLIDRELSKLDAFQIQKIVVQAQALSHNNGKWQAAFEVGSQIQEVLEQSPEAIVQQFLPEAISNPSVAKTGSRPLRLSPTRQTTSSSPIKLRPQSVTMEGWGALLTGLVLAILLFILSPLKMLFRGFLVLVHEIGHAIAHWLFGRPAIPMIDFAFGGGITLSFEQSWFILAAIYAAIAFLIFLCRVYPRLQGIVVLLTVLYSFCLFTNWNLILSTFMGHGMELIAIFACLYLSISGYFCRMGGDRAIYGMLGFFTLFCDLQFCWQLLYDVDMQAWYSEGKGGIIDNDLVILASEYFSVDLSTVVYFLLAGCLLSPVAAFLLFRYEAWLRASFNNLLFNG